MSADSTSSVCLNLTQGRITLATGKGVGISWTDKQVARLSEKLICWLFAALIFIRHLRYHDFRDVRWFWRINDACSGSSWGERIQVSSANV